MQFAALIPLALSAAGLVSASPLEQAVKRQIELHKAGILTRATSSINSTAWIPGVPLKSFEVILFGHERMEVVHKDVYKKLMADGHLYGVDTFEHPGPLPPTGWADKENNITARDIEEQEQEDSELAKRNGCVQSTNILIDHEGTFVDWDVQMSPILLAAGERTTITVTEGYSITNTLSVSVGLDAKAVDGWLGAKVSVDYSRAWQTSYQAALMGTIDIGKYGVMVTKPVTTRRQGRMLKGCFGNQRLSSTFQGDNRKEGQHGGLKWVAGIVTLCQKTVYPMKRCNGAGEFD